MTTEPFRVAVSDEALDDLKRRLQRTNWADDFANDDWSYGTNAAYLKELVTYWLETFDWRAQEAAINALPQYRTTIDGIPVHFVHCRGKGERPMPLIMSHGWPGRFGTSPRPSGRSRIPLRTEATHAIALTSSFPRCPALVFLAR